MNDPSARPARATQHALRASMLAVLATAGTAFGWLMCTLAAGALAALVALVSGLRPCWPLLVLALPLTFMLKLAGALRHRTAPFVAALAVLLAGAYAMILVAAARIAAIMGFPFLEAWRMGGSGLTLQVAALSLDVASILVCAAAAVAAAILAARLARRGAP